MTTDRPPAAAEPAPPHLSRWSFAFALAVSLGIFALLNPLWRPMDMGAMDRNIIGSYAPIPLLVLGLLALEHKLRWSSWVLETLRLTLVKFAITYLFANVMWTVVEPPVEADSSATAAAESGATPQFEPREAPPATVIDPDRTGRIEGAVVDTTGAPRADVLVAVTGGLQAFVYAPRPEGVRLQHDGRQLQPPRAIVQVYEALVMRSETFPLHTVVAVDAGGRTLFNVPLTPGAARRLMFDAPLGRVTLACTVHGQAEPAAELAIVANPFARWTGEDGRFTFDGVPAGELELTASDAAGRAATLRVSLEPSATIEALRLTLP